MTPVLSGISLSKHALLWATAGAGLLALFFFMTFPYDALQARVLAEVERKSGLDVRARNWTFGFPLTMEWRDVELAKRDFGPIRLEAMQARIGLLKLMLGDVALDLRIRQPGASADAGRAEVKVTADSWAFDGPLTLKGRVQHIDLSQVAGPYVSRGVAKAEFSQQWDGARTPGGSINAQGTWRLDVNDIVLERIPIGSATLPSLAFSRAAASLECHEAVCRILELQGDGTDGSFTGEGHITLQRPFAKSAVELTMTITPGPGFASKAAAMGLPPFPAGMPIKFKLTGPLSQVRPALA